MRRLYDLARRGIEGGQSARPPAAAQLRLRRAPLFDTMLTATAFPEGFRAALELRWSRCGRGRQPRREPQQRQRVEVQVNLKTLIEEFGVDEDRPGDQAKVAQVTDAVMAALRQRRQGN